jgi:ferredoxin
MVRYGMAIDITRCIGCYNCVLACKDEFCGNDYPPYSLSQPMTGSFWMKVIEKERGKYPKVKVAYLPVPCMHCDDAACLRAATDGAVYRRSDGIIIIAPTVLFSGTRKRTSHKNARFAPICSAPAGKNPAASRYAPRMPSSLATLIILSIRLPGWPPPGRRRCCTRSTG